MDIESITSEAPWPLRNAGHDGRPMPPVPNAIAARSPTLILDNGRKGTVPSRPRDRAALTQLRGKR